jgi:N-sulfoglucosamine sulfohydrolase
MSLGILLKSITESNKMSRLSWILAFCVVVPLSTAFVGTAKGQSAKRPNILLAIADDWSWPHAGAYGAKFVQTPAFDRVAREGALFTQAFCASPGCSPSRAALLTGRHTWELEHAGTHASSFSDKLVVYPDLLEEAGYFVGFTGKGWGPGNFQAGGRSRNPAGPAFSQIKLEPPLKGISGTDYAANFQAFLLKSPAGKPFCFWYGGQEPHLGYEKGSGLKAGKRAEDVEVPAFLPDTPEVRSDLLDYAMEVEHFDRHLGRMLEALQKAGELDHTMVVVISDDGMPFPRAKANCYEYGTHVPLAIRWPARVKAGRTVDDLVSYIDLAPTFLEAAGVAVPKMTGRSLTNVLVSEKSGIVDPSRNAVYSARERHSSSRVNNLGYPIRMLRTHEHLYIRNFAPDRWPAGDPRGVEGDAFGYYDIDGSPTKTLLAEAKDPQLRRFKDLAVAKRPAEELYDAKADPGNLVNLAGNPQHADVLARLRAQMDAELRRTGDPRMTANAEIFETYPRYSPIRKFE